MSRAIKHQLETLLQGKGWGQTLPHTHGSPARIFPTCRPELDPLLQGGLPRGHISEITGWSSSGKTRFLLSLAALATQQKEVVAWIDTNALDPASAHMMGVDLTRLLWVRCPEAGTILKAADILCRAGNFGIIVVDLTCEIARRQIANRRSQIANRKAHGAKAKALAISYPPSTIDACDLRLATCDSSDLRSSIFYLSSAAVWFRLQRAVEGTSTALLVMTDRFLAGSAAHLCLRIRRHQVLWSATQSCWQCLRGFEGEVEIVKGEHR